MQVARRFEWPPVVVVSISLHFFWLLLLLLCLGRERDEIRYGLGMSPLHSNTGVRQPNTHQKYQVRFQRAQGNKIKKKKRKLCLASVIDTTDTSEWKNKEGGGQQQQQLRGSLTTLSARHTNGQTIDIPARRRYAMAAGHQAGARASGAHSSVDSKRMIMGWNKRGACTCHSAYRPQTFFFKFYSCRWKERALLLSPVHNI